MAAKEKTPNYKNNIDNLCEYGRNMGMAFQIQDDLLDYVGDSKTCGKNVGDDLMEGKMTLPLIYALNIANPTQAKTIKRAIEDKSAADLNEIIAIIKQTCVLKKVRQCMQYYQQQALKNIEPITESIHKQFLIDIANLAANRKK